VAYRAQLVTDRFWSKVEKIPFHECWEWVGARCDKGYGRIDRSGILERAHRVAYEILVGDIPAGQHVLHRCDNPGCVRPDHLFLGSNARNMADKVSKGRQRKGEQIPSSRLTAKDVSRIRERSRSGESYSALARAFGVTRPAIRDAVTRRQWAHVV
jgi:hypothetical protein